MYLNYLSHSFRDIQEKTIRLQRFAQQVGLQVNHIKREVWPINVSAPLPTKIGQLHLKTSQQFTYLGSTVCSDGGRADLASGRGLVRLEEQLQNYVCNLCTTLWIGRLENDCA